MAEPDATVVADADDDDCAICWLPRTDPLTLVCRHTFCRACIREAMDYSRFCPLCRRDLADTELGTLGVDRVDVWHHIYVIACIALAAWLVFPLVNPGTCEAPPAHTGVIGLAMYARWWLRQHGITSVAPWAYPKSPLPLLPTPPPDEHPVSTFLDMLGVTAVIRVWSAFFDSFADFILLFLEITTHLLMAPLALTHNYLVLILSNI